MTETQAKETKEFFGKIFTKEQSTIAKTIMVTRYKHTVETEAGDITMWLNHYQYPKTRGSTEFLDLFRSEIHINNDNSATIVTDTVATLEQCSKDIHDKVRNLYRRTLLEAGKEDPQFLAIYLFLFDKPTQN
jgi:hypothetical protein